MTLAPTKTPATPQTETPVYPRITCVMPTTGRRRGVLGRAIVEFLAQDYPGEKRLLVIDEPGPGGEPLSLVLPEVQVVTLPPERPPLSIGQKRNLGCALADGEYVCCWDDDDHVSSDRLAVQAAPLRRGEADVTGFPLEDVLDAAAGRTWRASPALSREVFGLGVMGGTALFRRSLWETVAHYPDQSSGEDGAFLRRLVAGGARLVAVENAGRYVYVRHESRWPLDVTSYVHAAEWTEVVEGGDGVVANGAAVEPVEPAEEEVATALV